MIFATLISSYLVFIYLELYSLNLRLIVELVRIPGCYLLVFLYNIIKCNTKNLALILRISDNKSSLCVSNLIKTVEGVVSASMAKLVHFQSSKAIIKKSLYKYRTH